MNEQIREKIALFRFGLIAPLVNGQVTPMEYLEDMENKIHQVPYYRERKIASKTIQEWHLPSILFCSEISLVL